ncbi:MAG: hypothetical protein ACP5DC_00635 [Halothiobacillaceae bacterium]
MGRMAESYRLTRAVIPAVGLALLLVVLLWQDREAPPVETVQVTGQVVAVDRGTAESLRGNVTTLVTARVALPEGIEVRVPVFGRAPDVGESVQLEESRLPDGSRRWRLVRTQGLE